MSEPTWAKLDALAAEQDVQPYDPATFEPMDLTEAEAEAFRSALAADQLVVGPNDHLVLITKVPITYAELHRMQDRVPAALKGRVLIMDGTQMDAKVIRDA